MVLIAYDIKLTARDKTKPNSDVEPDHELLSSTYAYMVQKFAQSVNMFKKHVI